MVKLIIKETNFSYSKRHLFDMLDLLVEKYNWNYISKEELLNKEFKYSLLTKVFIKTKVTSCPWF